MKKKTRWFLIFSVVALIGGGVYLSQRSEAETVNKDASLRVNVKKHDFMIEVVDTGKVQPKERVEIKSKVAGQVIEVLVQEGVVVKKGQLLLRLDPIDFEREAARAEADVAQAKNALEYADLLHERKKRGLQERGVAQIEVELAANEVKTKSIALKIAEIALATARDRLRYTMISAPLDGTVIELGIKVGEVVTPGVQQTFEGRPLLTIGDLSSLIVRSELNQIDIAKIRLGQNVVLTFDALPGKRFEAEVTKSAPAAIKPHGKEVEVFPVEATLSAADDTIKPGMTADVRFEIETKPAVLAVPIEAVVKDAGKSYVTKIVLAEGKEKTEKAEITVGARNDRELEIATGLAEGDTLLIKPASSAANEVELSNMWREYVRIALRALRAHKFRSALTVSSITLGAFSIVLMSSLATSGLTTLAKDIEELGGARIIMIAPKRPERVPGKEGTTPGLITPKDREILFSALPHTAAKSMYATLDRKDVINDRGETARTDFVAADGGFVDVLALKIGEGRFFTEEENKRHARVCVVAYDLANEFWEGKAVGRWLTIDGDRCLIVGQLAKVDHWDTNFGFKWLDFVAMPLETAAETRPAVRAESFIQIKTDHVSSNEIVKRIANAILVDRHNNIDDFQIWDFNAFMKQFYMIFAIMESVVGLIAGIALLVGGIGVMNMMLVSVSERTREIGIRKALGASPTAIASQFLWEAVVLAGFGGLTGTALGVLSAIGVNFGIKQLKSMWVGEISHAAVMVALMVSIVIGVSFGFFPARRASKLDPVLAIRR